MDYGLILIIAAYLGAVQLATRTNTGVLLCSFIAVGLPYLVGLIVKGILMNVSNLSEVAHLFSKTETITFIAQFIVAFIVFKKIRNNEDIASTIGWSIGGFLLIIMLVPFVVQKIIS